MISAYMAHQTEQRCLDCDLIIILVNGKFINIRIQSNFNIKFSSTNSHAFYEAFIDLHGLCSQKGLPYEILRLRKERERERKHINMLI